MSPALARSCSSSICRNLCLTESFWEARRNVATERYFIVDAATGTVTRYASSTQGYADAEYQALLEECGFGEVTFHPSLCGDPDGPQSGLMVIVCRRNAPASGRRL